MVEIDVDFHQNTAYVVLDEKKKELPTKKLSRGDLYPCSHQYGWVEGSVMVSKLMHSGMSLC